MAERVHITQYVVTKIIEDIPNENGEIFFRSLTIR